MNKSNSVSFTKVPKKLTRLQLLCKKKPVKFIHYIAQLYLKQNFIMTKFWIWLLFSMKLTNTELSFLHGFYFEKTIGNYTK